MAQLEKTIVRLEIRLNNARIYAIRGDFIIVEPEEAKRYDKVGEKPLPTPGF